MKSARNWITLVLVCALLVLAGISAYLFFSLREARTTTAPLVSDPDPATLIAEVAALIDVPEGEVPTIATVSDPERLKTQPFFARAQVGHVVLIYAEAKKAYLYDPERKRIVDVAPLNIGADAVTVPAPDGDIPQE